MFREGKTQTLEQIDINSTRAFAPEFLVLLGIENSTTIKP